MTGSGRNRTLVNGGFRPKAVIQECAWIKPSSALFDYFVDAGLELLGQR